MADVKALFQSVVAKPDDDAVRLVYADALSEQGDPRGEFIAVQCKLAAGRSGVAAAKALRRREEELLDAHGEEWLGPLQRFLRENDSYGLSQVKLHRGFVVQARVQLSGPEVLPTLYRHAPLLERLTLRGGEAALLPAMRALKQLDAEGPCAGSVAQWVNDAPFPRLTHLTLAFPYGARRPRALRLDHHPHLQVLDMDRTRVEDVRLPASLERLGWVGFENAAALSGLTSLTTLRLGDTALAPPMLEALERLAPQLTTLELTTRNLDALRALLGWPWPKLEHFDLSKTRLGVDGAGWVAGLRAPSLTSLDLTGTSLTGPGTWTVLRAPLLGGLRQLSLRNNRLTDADLADLPALEHQLILLNLKKNRLTAGFLAKLAKRFPDTRLSR